MIICLFPYDGVNLLGLESRISLTHPIDMQIKTPKQSGVNILNDLHNADVG